MVLGGVVKKTYGWTALYTMCLCILALVALYVIFRVKEEKKEKIERELKRQQSKLYGEDLCFRAGLPAVGWCFMLSDFAPL